MRFSQILAKFAVSLFTRERIEIVLHWLPFLQPESPSLRGSGLKSIVFAFSRRFPASPSLRGSGLKSSLHPRLTAAMSLPLYEGAD